VKTIFFSSGTQNGLNPVLPYSYVSDYGPLVTDRTR